MDPDDSLGTTVTDRYGNFTIIGKEDEMMTIRPYVRVLHICEVADPDVSDA